MFKVIEIFASIQGESSHAGLPCAFVRLEGCNLRCRYCDTAYAYEGGRAMSLAQVLAEVADMGIELVELTGGEPLLHEETPELARALMEAGHRVLVETNGSLPISALPLGAMAIVDMKTPGSGMSGMMDMGNLHALRPGDEVKFVITSRGDYEWARSVILEHKVHERAAVLLSPAYGALAPELLVKWMLEDRLQARLNLQLHKYIWSPNKRGV